LRGEPAARRLEGQVRADDDEDALHETGTTVELDTTEGTAGDEAIRTIDEDAHEPVDHQTIGDHSTQLAEAATTDEVEDLPAGDAADETDVTPAEMEVVSVTGEDVGPGRKGAADTDTEACVDAEQPAEEQEMRAGPSAEPLIEPVAETVGEKLGDQIDPLALDSENEESTLTGAEVNGREFDDSAVGSDVVDTAVLSGDIDALQPDRGRAPASEGGAGGGVTREEDVATLHGGPTSEDAGDPRAKPEPDDSLPPVRKRERHRRPAPKYRAPAGGPPPRRRPSNSQTTRGNASPSAARARPAAIDVRVVFQRGGYSIVSLLPHRLPGLPDELVVSSEAGNVDLLALQDERYQDVVPYNLAELLRTGIMWKHSDTGQEWLLSGREVFVLAHGTTHRGFVSCPRLALGREHVVLCTATQLGLVEDALKAAGCAGWTQLGEHDGAPAGWRVLRNVIPWKSVPPSSDSDILNILRPLPEVEIALEGGIRLAYNIWLLGYPPVIRIYGDPEHIEVVLIDGHKAAGSEQDGYTAPGWDVEGDHQVWCGSTSRSYSLVRSEPSSTYWPAYSFTLRSTRGEDHKFEFCGPLVRPIAAIGRSDQRQVVQVPPSNPILLGARPGEVYFARLRSDLRGAQCLAMPPFDPVWALPPQPLRCDKRANRILLVGEPSAGISNASRETVCDRRSLEMWCRLILDAGRKGLALEPASLSTRDLWRRHKRLARSLWRNLR
jgi:hypothetical protein